MSSLISNSGKFSGGYFVLNNEAIQSDFVETREFIVTHKRNRGLLECIIKLINEANDYIKICSFIIDNKQVVESLKNQLKIGKVSVFILTAVDDKSIKSNILDEDETRELSRSRHFEFIDELVKAGAHVRASSNAHAKFVITDGAFALLMSANLTEPSLNNNEKENYPNDESGVLTEELAEVSIAERLFDSVFLYGTEYRKFLNLSDKTQLISKNDNEICLTDFPETHSNIIWSYENLHHLIYANLNSIIKSASASVKLSTYSIVSLDNLSEFILNIKEFIENRKGVVKIFCRAMNHRVEHLNSCKQLVEMGVQVFGDMYNHSKGISVDDREGIMFTANIDGKHGLKSGFEIGYRIEKSNEIFKSFNSFLDCQINSAPFVFVISPNKEDVFNFYKLWYANRGIKPTVQISEEFEIKLRANAIYASEFQFGVSNFPIFYTALSKPDKKEIQFEMNTKVYLLEMLNDTTFGVVKQLTKKEVVSAEKFMLFYNKIKLTTYES